MFSKKKFATVFACDLNNSYSCPNIYFYLCKYDVQVVVAVTVVVVAVVVMLAEAVMLVVPLLVVGEVKEMLGDGIQALANLQVAEDPTTLLLKL